MQSAYFPLFIDISDKNILIIGGGHIAARRAETLLRFTEKLTIVSPQLNEKLSAYIKNPEKAGNPKGAEDPESAEAFERIRWIPCVYSPQYLSGMDIVLAATDCREVNRQVAADCRVLEEKEGRRILVNTADDKSQCDFYFPSVVQNEEITIGINSGGHNPQKVKKIRKKVQEMLKFL